MNYEYSLNLRLAFFFIICTFVMVITRFDLTFSGKALTIYEKFLISLRKHQMKSFERFYDGEEK